MRKIISSFIAFLFVFTWGLYAQEKVVVSIDEANPPFMYKDEATGQAAGLYALMVKAVFKKMGKNVEVNAVPWKRAVQLCEDGAAGVGGIYKNEKRLKIFDYSGQIFEEKLVFYTKKGSGLTFKTVDNLKGKKVGVIRGWSYGDDFDGARQKQLFEAEENVSDELNFQKLALGRIDYLVAILQSGDSVIAKLNLQDKVELLETPLAVNPTYLVFGKKANLQAVLSQFDATVNIMKQDGSYQAVVKEAFK